MVSHWISMCLSVRHPIYCTLVHPYFISRWWVNISGFLPDLVCTLILWRSGLGLLIGKFCQFLTVTMYLPVLHLYFRFWTITWVNVNEFPLNLVHVCALILWRSGLGLLFGKFHFDIVLCRLHDSGGLLSLCPQLRRNWRDTCFWDVCVCMCACVRPLRFLMHSKTSEPSMLGFWNFIYGFFMKK